MLHFHAPDLKAVHNNFGFPFQRGRPIQDEMMVKRVAVICYSENLIGSGVRFI